MQDQTERKHRSFGGAILAVSLIALMCYLTLAALQGEHGLFRLLQIEAQEARLREELAGIRTERQLVANKTSRLSAQHLDPDLLDERARAVLGLARPDEIIIR